MKSQASASSSPPPRAKPSTQAMTGGEALDRGGHPMAEPRLSSLGRRGPRQRADVGAGDERPPARADEQHAAHLGAGGWRAVRERLLRAAEHRAERAFSAFGRSM